MVHKEGVVTTREIAAKGGRWGGGAVGRWTGWRKESRTWSMVFMELSKEVYENKNHPIPGWIVAEGKRYLCTFLLVCYPVGYETSLPSFIFFLGYGLRVLLWCVDSFLCFRVLLTHVSTLACWLV